MTITSSKTLRIADAVGRTGRPDWVRRTVRLLLAAMREQRLAIAADHDAVALLNHELDVEGFVIDRFKRLDRRGETIAALAARKSALLGKLRQEVSPC